MWQGIMKQGAQDSLIAEELQRARDHNAGIVPSLHMWSGMLWNKYLSYGKKDSTYFNLSLTQKFVIITEQEPHTIKR